MNDPTSRFLWEAGDIEFLAPDQPAPDETTADDEEETDDPPTEDTSVP